MTAVSLVPPRVCLVGTWKTVVLAAMKTQDLEQTISQGNNISNGATDCFYNVLTKNKVFELCKNLSEKKKFKVMDRARHDVAHL